MSYSFPIQEKGLGYEPAEVDDFISKARRQFEDASQTLVSSSLARHATFKLVKGGYSIVAVDTAIDRLEDTFAQKEISQQLIEQGDFALDDRLARFTESLQVRIQRPKSKRFKRASWPLRGYSAKQVDALCITIERFLVANSTLTAADVRSQLFKAKRGGYSESQVDAFLDRTIDVIQLRSALTK